MDTTTVATETPFRPVKPARDLAPGDWIGAGPYSSRIDGTDDARVLFVHEHTIGATPAVAVMIQEAAVREPLTIHLDAAADIPLLTADEVDEVEREGERARFIAGIRLFADWLEQRPWLPVPDSLEAMVHLRYATGADSAGLAEFRELAQLLDTETDESLEDRTRIEVPVGPIRYQAIAWHRDGRPADS